jgi:hypothetical protein
MPREQALPDPIQPIEAPPESDVTGARVGLADPIERAAPSNEPLPASSAEAQPVAETRALPTQSSPATLPRNGQSDERLGTCTAPQLRRFIKSRPYVPLHELRRRFGIDGDDDEVSAVDLTAGRIFVGLPGRESGLLGDLLRAGDIGFELSVDPATPIVVGVFPMRPVGRG